MNILNLIPNFEELVGIRQTQNANYPTLSASLTTSLSGLWVDNLLGDTLTAEKVIDILSQYRDTPSQLSNLLETKRKDAVACVLNDVFVKLTKQGTPIIYQGESLLFSERYTFNEQILNPNAFYGIEIKFNSPNVQSKVKITKISLATNTAQNFNLYLYNSKTKRIFQEIPLVSKNYNTDSDFFIDVNIELFNYDNGVYFLGIFPSEFVPNTVFAANNFAALRKKSYLNNTFFEIQINNCDKDTVYNALNQTFANVQAVNFPFFNVYISIENDLDTDFVRMKSYFALPVQLKWAIMLLETYTQTTRTNADALMNRDSIGQLLKGSEITKQNNNSIEVTRNFGLYQKYGEAIESVIVNLGNGFASLTKPMVRVF